VGVSQWHGYTAFQSPHTGIDFSVSDKTVITPRDGVVIFAGWDSANGKCLSGGNIVIVEHDNGFHTAYFHLKSLVSPDRRQLTTGLHVSKGQPLATSGNTGAWNCQPLGGHLHYEVRTSKSQSTHIDPVPVVDINWSTIPTAGWQQNQGRLSGDNPHPTY